jgi:hypothetical protein
MTVRTERQLDAGAAQGGSAVAAGGE